MSAGKLPEGWVDTQLGNIVDYGKATKRVLSDVNDDTWVLELEDIEKESSKLLSTIRAGERPFKSTKNSFQKGDVLYGKLRPYLNKIIIAEEDGVCTTEIIPLSAEPSCCNKYIFYWLKSSTFLGYVNDVSYGVNMPRLGTADGLKAPLRLAPLAEQKIIAEKLDTLLAQVDSTKARLEQIPQILKRFRQAVLATAVSGELTKHLTQTKKNEVTLDKIATIIDPHPSHRTPKIDNAGIPYIGIGDIQPDGKINFTSARKVSVDVFIEHRARYTLNEGDFIFGKIGTLGKACVLPIGFKYTLSANVILIQPIKDKVSSDYLRYFLSSPLTMQEITQQANSTSQAAFGIKKMRAFKCNLPSLVEQHEIVRRVEQLFAYADTIEKQVNSALARVNSLTQSVLAKAFRGELTAQWRAENPDLISGENSAAALLEKIKAERAASGGKKASRKKN